MSPPSLVSRTVHGLAWACGLSAHRARRMECLRIVMLHGVGGAHLSTVAFVRQLRYVKRNFEVLPLADLLERLRVPGRVTGREVALTFDDGLANHVAVAQPILVRFRLPATFFVCPGLIDQGRWLWNHEARARLAYLGDEARLGLLDSLDLSPAEDLSGRPAFGADPDDPVTRMKALVLARRRAAEAAIREATPSFRPTAAQRADHDVMTWDDVLGLDPRWITVGAHTSTHPTLPTLDDDDLRVEVEESGNRLEERLGRSVTLFCYPNGDEDDRVRAVAARRYEGAVTTRAGVVHPGDDPYRLARIGVADGPATLAWRFHVP
ncbi:MAG: polysaccharide deacetylase family protein [Planctomycetota bacterium]